MSANPYSSLCISNKFCAYGFRQDNNIVITIHAASNGWASLGTGDKMDGSDMYVVYKENSTCVVSRRQGNGYNSPSPAAKQIATIVENAPKEAAPQTVPAWAKLICSFSRPINTSDNSIPDARASYIWAIGELAGNNDIAQHSIDGDYGRQSNHNILQSGQKSVGSAGQVPFIKADPDTYNLILFAHGILFFIAWAVAPFIGIFIARYLKDVLGAWWYTLHLFIMIGVTGGFSLASFILIILYKQGPHLSTTHEYIGVTVFVLLVMQIIMGFISNAKWSPERTSIPWWDQAHWWLGRIVVVLGIVNIYFGIIEFHTGLGITNHTSVLITFGVIVGLGVVCMIVGQFIYGQVHHLNESDMIHKD